MRKGIFKRIFILSSIILLSAVLAVEISVTGAVRKNAIESTENHLAAQAALAARDIPFTATAPLDRLCGQLKDATGARVTVIAPDGRVLGDSDRESALMENHASRPEIQEASLSGRGSSLRYSETLKTDLLYVARKIERGDRMQGFVRLSVPLSDVDAAINSLRFKLIFIISAILIVMGFFLGGQLDRLRRLTNRIRDFSASLAAGRLERRIFPPQTGEFEDIADSLNNMALALQAEIKSLGDEKAKFETALLGISDGVLLLNQAGKVELANKVFHEMFGVKGEITGRPFLDVVRNHRLADMVREAHERHRPASGELEIAFPKELYLFATALPIIQESMREDQYRGTVVALHDITQLKRLEQVRKDFVANVSHEIKTPITAIQGFAETLLAGALDDREHALKFIETIRANSRRIDSLVDDLMTISKIELGVIKVEKTDLAFEDVAEAVLSLLREKAANRNLSLAASVPPGLGMIQADRDRLIQILTNLVDNAIKFTERGGVTFGVGEESGRTFLFVEDTGPGIPEKHIPRLGERFYRVDTARSRNMGGTGLGLAIVKHLVKAHGWDMQIDSKVGRGTTVKIYL
jgi:two-component system phosphate regulon sensor histidine kinase PhoR